MPATTDGIYRSSKIGHLTMKAVRSFVNTGARLHGPLVQLYDGASCDEVQLGPQLTGLSVAARDVKEDRLILHFHGGAHCVGNAWCTRELVGRLSAATKARVVSVNYRLAPEHPFPAGLDDALAAWAWVCREHPASSVAVAGDSAGGNLAFALLVKLAQLGEPQPVACIAMSPWLLLDHAKCLERSSSQRSLSRNLSSSSMQAAVVRTISDKFDRDWQSGAARCVGRYCQDVSPDDPLISPVLADVDLVRRFPPVLIHASEGEPLADDAREMSSLCQRSGVPIELELFPGNMHVFQAVPFLSKKASDSLQKMDSFLETYWHTATAGCGICISHAAPLSPA